MARDTKQPGNGGDGRLLPRANEGVPDEGGPGIHVKDTFARPLKKRFYATATVGGGAPFKILLDGRPVRTPAKRALALPAREAAEAVAAEWNAQTTFIQPHTMPLTRLTNSAVDAVSDALPDVVADIVAFAGRDLLCYRAATPEDLAQVQAAHWDPVLNWYRESLGARFRIATGVTPVEQPSAALDIVSKLIGEYDAFEITALHVMTALTGSALLTVAVARGFLSASEAWAAAHVDETYQTKHWGRDEEAERRQASRSAEFNSAWRYFALLSHGRAMP